MSHPHSSSISPQQRLVLDTINKHGQITTSQVRRLLYQGTEDGKRVRSQRHLTRLYKLGLVRRVWSVYGDRVAEYLYMPQGTTTRGAVLHSLDVTEIFVQLSVRLGPGFIFDREPLAHMQIGRVVLKPDAYLDLGGSRRAFCELDRGTERRPQLAKQMRQYVRAYLHEWDGDKHGSFPQVLFIVPDADRRRYVESVVKAQDEPELFHVLLFIEAVDLITK